VFIYFRIFFKGRGEGQMELMGDSGVGMREGGGVIELSFSITN